MVTSYISEKFLPGILIGYISELENDANNLTKSGYITPVVDFRHLQEVLVILELKEYSADDLTAAPGGSGVTAEPGQTESGQTEAEQTEQSESETVEPQ